MCGVIVVEAGRSRSTCLGCDAYIHDHCLGYLYNYSLFYEFPNSNLSTHRFLFSREKPLVKPTAPGSILHHLFARSIFLFAFPFYFLFYFQIYIIINPKIPCCVLFTITLFASIDIFFYRFILPMRD